MDEDGLRWIIDFKTSAHEGGSTEAFLESEVERYRPQLERYAAAMSAMDSRPIRVGGRLNIMTDRVFPGLIPGPVDYHARVAIRSNPAGPILRHCHN